MTLIGLNGAIGGEMTNGFVVPGLDSQEAYDLLSERFPAEGGTRPKLEIAIFRRVEIEIGRPGYRWKAGSHGFATTTIRESEDIG